MPAKGSGPEAFAGAGEPLAAAELISRWTQTAPVPKAGATNFQKGRVIAPGIREVDMRELWHWLKHEFHEVLPPTIFFLIAFHIVVIDRRLMLREYGLPLSSIVGATVGALLIAKVVLITDKFPFINRFPGKPLIYNVAWKTAIYMAAAVLIHYLEHLVPIWWRTGDLATANRHLTTEIVWPHFWAIQLWLIVLLFVYCSLREMVRAIGREKVVDLFFGRSAARVLERV